VRACVPSVFD